MNEKTRGLPDLVSGKKIGASLTETEAVDASNVQTKAVPESRTGKTWFLTVKNATKSRTGAHSTTVLTVMARTPCPAATKPASRVSGHAANSPGPFEVVRGRAMPKLPASAARHALGFAVFNDMPVRENILALLPKALRVAPHRARFRPHHFGASCTGPARRAVAASRGHAKTRGPIRSPLRRNFEFGEEKIRYMLPCVRLEADPPSVRRP